MRGSPHNPVIIAHRGASGYLPEHSLAAKAMAYGMGADFLEQDVVASRDGELLVLHDLYLDDVSNVAGIFPRRARADWHFYCIDFDLAEIRTLSFGERLNPDTGAPRFPGRYPRNAGDFPVVTLTEEIHFIQRLNAATGRRVGIYPELKDPAWHAEQGIDLSGRVLAVLHKFGYLAGGGEPVFLQCLDAEELKRISKTVGARLPIIQLLGSGTAVDNPLLQEISDYAVGIGPAIKLICLGSDIDGKPEVSKLVQAAHDIGLAVHPYTFRADELPAAIVSFEELLALFIDRLQVDGLFTDFTDQVAEFLSRRHSPA